MKLLVHVYQKIGAHDLIYSQFDTEPQTSKIMYWCKRRNLQYITA